MLTYYVIINTHGHHKGMRHWTEEARVIGQKAMLEYMEQHKDKDLCAMPYRPKMKTVHNCVGGNANAEYKSKRSV